MPPEKQIQVSGFRFQNVSKGRESNEFQGDFKLRRESFRPRRLAVDAQARKRCCWRVDRNPVVSRQSLSDAGQFWLT